MKRWDTGTALKHYKEGVCFPAVWCHRTRFLKAGHLAFLCPSGACRKEPQHLAIDISYGQNPYHEGLTAQVRLTKLHAVIPSQLLQRQKTTTTTQQLYWLCVCQVQPVCRLEDTERGSCQLPCLPSPARCQSPQVLVSWCFSQPCLYADSPQVRKWKNKKVLLAWWDKPAQYETRTRACTERAASHLLTPANLRKHKLLD